MMQVLESVVDTVPPLIAGLLQTQLVLSYLSSLMVAGRCLTRLSCGPSPQCGQELSIFHTWVSLAALHCTLSLTAFVLSNVSLAIRMQCCIGIAYLMAVCVTLGMGLSATGVHAQC